VNVSVGVKPHGLILTMRFGATVRMRQLYCPATMSFEVTGKSSSGSRNLFLCLASGLAAGRISMRMIGKNLQST
jgi:hypothetical protein